MDSRGEWQRTYINESCSENDAIHTVWSHQDAELEYVLRRNYSDEKKWTGTLRDSSGEKILHQKFNSKSRAYTYLIRQLQESPLSEKYPVGGTKLANEEAWEQIQWKIEDEEVISDCRDVLADISSESLSHRLGRTVAPAVVYHVVSTDYPEKGWTQDELADRFSCTRSAMWNSLNELRECISAAEKGTA